MSRISDSDFGWCCHSLGQECLHKDLKVGLSSVCCKLRPFCWMLTLAGLDTPWMHPATTAQGRWKFWEGGNRIWSFSLPVSPQGPGQGWGVGPPTGAKAAEQESEISFKRKQQVLFSSLPRAKLSEAFVCSFPLQEITHPLGSFLKTMWKLANGPPKMLWEEKLCKICSA